MITMSGWWRRAWAIASADGAGLGDDLEPGRAGRAARRGPGGRPRGRRRRAGGRAGRPSRGRESLVPRSSVGVPATSGRSPSRERHDDRVPAPGALSMSSRPPMASRRGAHVGEPMMRRRRGCRRDRSRRRRRRSRGLPTGSSRRSSIEIRLALRVADDVAERLADDLEELARRPRVEARVRRRIELGSSTSTRRAVRATSSASAASPATTCVPSSASGRSPR